MLLNPKPYSQNCDVLDMSQNFGLSASNEVTTLPGFAGTDVDEMNLNYIAQIPAYYQSFSWDAINPINNELMVEALQPSQLFTTQPF